MGVTGEDDGVCRRMDDDPMLRRHNQRGHDSLLGVVRRWEGILGLYRRVDPEDLSCVARLGMRRLSLWNLKMGQDPLDLPESLADAFQSGHNNLPA